MVSHAPSGLRGWIQVPLAQAAWGRSVASLACLLVMPVRITESTPGEPMGLASRRAGAGLEPTRGNPIRDVSLDAILFQSNAGHGVPC